MKNFKRAVALILAITMLWSMLSVRAESSTNIQTELQLDVGYSARVGTGETVYLSFTPEKDGNYVFTSYADEDTYGYLYTSDMYQLASNDDGGNNSNFLIKYYLTAGTTYIYGARYYSDSRSGEFEVKVFESLSISSMVFDPLSIIEYSSGEYDYYQNNDGDAIQYYKYNWANKLSYTATMSDGGTVTGSGNNFYYNGESFYLRTSDDQGYDEQWSVGNTYSGLVFDDAGNRYNVNISITESPIESIVFEPITMIENTSGYYSNRYNPEKGEYENYYRYNWWNYLEYTVYFNDGTSVESSGTGFYYNDVYYSLSYSDIQHENPWKVGETYAVPLSTMGYTANASISVVECPIANIDFKPVSMVENTGGSYSSRYDSETEEDVEYYRYYWWNKLKYTITYKDGTSQECSGTSFYYNNQYYQVSYTDKQSSTPWTVGNSYTVLLTVMGKSYASSVSVVKTPIKSIEFEPISIITNTGGYINERYDSETEEYVEYYYYRWYSNLNYTVTFEDGTVVESTDTGFNYNDEYYRFNYNDNQSNIPWIAGNTYNISMSVMGYSAELNVSIVESPITSIDFEPISIIQGTNGYTTDRYNPETGEYEDYYRYEWYNKLKYTVNFEDGTKIEATGTGFNYNDEYYSFNYSDIQHDNPWTEVNVYKIPIKVMGYSTEISVAITDSPIKNITFDPISIIQETNGYRTNRYDSDKDEYVEFYRYEWSNKLNYTVTFEDGTVVESSNSNFEYNGETYYLNFTDNQSQNPWTVGNTYKVPVKVMGFNAEVSVEITESDIVSIVFEPISVIENSDGYINDRYNPETGEYEDYYRYSWWNKLKYTITFNDGTFVEGRGNGFSHNNEYYSFNYTDTQNVSPWTVGNTYTVPVSAMGYVSNVSVTINKSPITSIEFEPISVIENSDGYTDNKYNHETGEYEYYYRYSWWNKLKYTITFNDGTTLTSSGNDFRYNDVYYSFSTSDNQYNEHWIKGNTYTTTVSVMGYSANVNVAITGSPIQSVVFEPISIIAGTNCGISESYNNETGEYEKYTYYYWSNKLKYTITMNDGTVITGNGSGFNYNNQYYSFSYSDRQHSNHWTEGNTYSIELSALGYKATANVTITPSPIKKMVANPIIIEENAYHTNSDYDNTIGEWVEYKRYEWRYRLSFTVEFDDNTTTTCSGNWLYYKNESFYIQLTDSQGPQNEWIPGNTYTETFSVMGVTGEIPIVIAKSIVSGDFSYVELNGEAIITDCTSAAEKLIIPSTIDGLPVVGITDLGDALGYAKEVVIPDSVTALDQGVFEYYNNICEKLTIGSGVLSIPINSLSNYADNLKEINVSSDNPNYATVDGVLYTKDVTRLLFYPSGRTGVYNIPATVTDIDNIIFNIFNYPDVKLEFANDKTGYTKVDGIVYTSDMTTVVDSDYDRVGEYVMPDSVTHVRELALAYNKLTSIIVAPGVTDIVYCAYGHSPSLESITLPDKLETIGDSAFIGSGLTSIDIPDNVTEVAGSAFADTPLYNNADEGAVYIDSCLYGYKGFMPSNTKLNIAEGTTIVANYAFNESENLTEITIPVSLRTIGRGAFDDCPALKEINISEGNENFYMKDGVLYDKNGEVIVALATKAEFTYYGPDEWYFGRYLSRDYFEGKVYYADGSYGWISGWDMTISRFSPYYVGKQTVTVSYAGFEQSFEITVMPSENNLTQGDIDGDGYINAWDLVEIRKIILIAANDADNSACDVNGDSVIDLRDLIAMKRIVAENTPSVEPEEPGILGDIDGDGIVSEADYEIMTKFIAAGVYNSKADLNEDGVVNLDDMKILEELMNGGSVTGPAVGDFDGDGKVTDEDLTDLRSQVNSGEYNEVYDLNNDGVLDLRDVVLLKQIIADAENEDKTAQGDLDGDGEVTDEDLSALRAMINSGEYNKAADLNGDGVLDTRDVVALKQLLA